MKRFGNRVFINILYQNIDGYAREHWLPLDRQKGFRTEQSQGRDCFIEIADTKI